MKLTKSLRYAAAAAGGAIATYAVYSGFTWVRYGHVRTAQLPPDHLLDRFIPDPEVDEYHSFVVRAPAATTFAAAKDLDLQGSPFVKLIFGLRAIPSMVRGHPFRPEGPRSILDETLGLGWGVLAEEPDREIVVGSYTQPWHEDVTFHALPAESFAAFDEPGYAKIVWTLGARPIDAETSLFETRTRVVTTDAGARKLFRRYWSPMSAGIILIRYLSLPLVRKEAERRARLAASASSGHLRGQQPIEDEREPAGNEEPAEASA